jgi:hypothetical protein
MVSKLWIGLLGLDLGVVLLHSIMQTKFLEVHIVQFLVLKKTKNLNLKPYTKNLNLKPYTKKRVF